LFSLRHSLKKPPASDEAGGEVALDLLLIDSLQQRAPHRPAITPPPIAEQGDVV
jgi:hypothetical protein